MSSQKNQKPVLRFQELAQLRTRVRVLLVERPNYVIEGTLTGFDEYMNLLLENAVEINTKSEQTQELYTLMLKSDTIAMVLQKPTTA